MNELKETAAKLETIKAQIEALLDEAVEVLMDHPGIAHRSYETWVARIETALTDQSEFCLSCDYTLEDAIRALREWRKVA
jgi:ElaB/YqjD/DUF883 family membrane-anchored ribosome-binding protein